MKIRADEHISRKIVRAIAELALRDGWELTHVRDVHDRRTADETWIPRFAREGGKAILSGDRKMRGRPHQIAAISESGLVCVFLSHEWSTARRTVQAASLLFWWERIEAKISVAKPRECWLVPFEFSKGDLMPYSISYDKIEQQNRKR